MNAHSRFDPVELDDLRLQNPVSRIFREAGVTLDARGMCRCPFHGDKTPSCEVKDKILRFRCYGCGERGDVIDAVRAFTGKSFPDAVAHLGGTRPLTPVQRDEVIQQAAQAETEREVENERKRSKARRLFGGGLSIAGTHAAKYLERRGIAVVPRMWGDLRFHPALKYYAGTPEPIGEFPAMLAAIRDVTGTIIGCHRTYLDPLEPVKLSPPSGGPAKKIEGLAENGMIWLSPRGEGSSLILGEGIETSLSGYQMAGELGAPDDAAVIAAVSIGNLSGSAVARMPHPTKAKATIPNGIPDHNRPGMILPDHIDDAVFILVDGDSETFVTRAHAATAGQRFFDLGREAYLCPAPAGKDHNDVLLQLILEGV
jgi:hypothetical protein